MSKLDRFAQGLKDPQQEEPVTHCAYCGGEIYQDERVILHDGDYYCSDNCFVQDLLENGIAERVSIHAY
jgi:predicted nucleic acid-binding Zn ribbon protein